MRLRAARCLPELNTFASVQKRCSSSSRTIQEHDVLLIRQQGQKHPKWHLSAPLRYDKPAVKLSYGASLSPGDLIGKSFLDRVTDSTGRDCVLHDPSLSSYIMQSERMATPIYPHDASMIVSMLGLGPERPGESDYLEDAEGRQQEPFEMIEAGTGMGSLSLHIARAIHAGNPAVPANLRKALASARMRANAPYAPSEGLETVRPWDRLDLSEEDAEGLKTYLGERKVVLHTLDNRRAHTLAAHKLVRGFRRAQYLSDMDFHVGTVEEFVKARLGSNGGTPFLSRAILDLPQPSLQAEFLLPALKRSALVLVFQPSISQIAAFSSWAPPRLRLERVVELAPTGVRSDEGHDPSLADSGGGRVWDLRSTVVKSGEQKGERVMVMRPKVGEMLGGGGFVGVWRVWPEREGQREEREAGKGGESEAGR